MLIFLLLTVGAVIAAFLVAYAAGARERTSRLALCTLCGVLLVLHSVVLAAGVLGWLTTGGVAALLGGVLVTAAWRCRRVGRDREAPIDEPPRFTVPTLLCPLAAVVAAGTWAWPHLTDATRLWIWDDYTYHMVYPVVWLREHAIAAVLPENAFTMQAWYPLSASVVSTWFMLPFADSRGDALAWVSLTGLLYAGIVACGAAELLARLGCRPAAWAVPVVLLATSQRIGVMASSFSDADLAQAAALFAAFVLSIPRGEGERPDDIRADAWYGALLSGLALGMKVSAVPTTLIVLAMIVWRASVLGTRRRTAARIALVFAAGGLATSGYWYGRNVIHTGNPFYPAAFFFWPGATFPHTTLREYAQHYGVGRAVSDALVVYLNWPPFHAAAAIVGLGGLAAFLVVRRGTMTRPQMFFACGTLAITALTLLLLPSMPYSAGNGMTFAAGIVHWDSMRYVALVPILGWVALAFVLNMGAPQHTGAPLARRTPKPPLAPTVVGATVIIGALLASELTWAGVALVLVAATALAVLVARVGLPRLSRRAALATAVASATVLAGGMAWVHGAKAAATATAFHREPLFGAASAVLDRQPVGTRVAVFGDQWIYPTFGVRHHLVPVRVDGNGRVATTPIGGAMTPGDLTVDPWTFRRNLAMAYIGVVAVVHLPHPGRSPAWPAQATALENVRGPRLLYRDGAVGLWKLGE